MAIKVRVLYSSCSCTLLGPLVAGPYMSNRARFATGKRQRCRAGTSSVDRHMFVGRDATSKLPAGIFLERVPIASAGRARRGSY